MRKCDIAETTQTQSLQSWYLGSFLHLIRVGFEAQSFCVACSFLCLPKYLQSTKIILAAKHKTPDHPHAPNLAPKFLVQPGQAQQVYFKDGSVLHEGLPSAPAHSATPKTNILLQPSKSI